MPNIALLHLRCPLSMANRSRLLLVLLLALFPLCALRGQPLSNWALPDIKSVQCYRAGNTLNTPIVRLHSNDALVLEFDNLSDDPTTSTTPSSTVHPIGNLRRYRITTSLLASTITLWSMLATRRLPRRYIRITRSLFPTTMLAGGSPETTFCALWIVTIMAV